MAFLFELNEYLPKEHKLTDYQLARCIRNEFPKWKRADRFLAQMSGTLRSRNPYDQISYYRREYNRGTLHDSSAGSGRHGPISFRYDGEGNRLSFWGPGRGRRINLLSPEEYEQTIDRLSKYGADIRRPTDLQFEIKPISPPRKKPGPKTYDSFDWCI